MPCFGEPQSWRGKSANVWSLLAPRPLASYILKLRWTTTKILTGKRITHTIILIQLLLTHASMGGAFPASPFASSHESFSYSYPPPTDMTVNSQQYIPPPQYPTRPASSSLGGQQSSHETECTATSSVSSGDSADSFLKPNGPKSLEQHFESIWTYFRLAYLCFSVTFLPTPTLTWSQDSFCVKMVQFLEIS
jgi:hypothetical protein